MPRRSSERTRYDILSYIAKGPRKITAIMHGANLNYNTLKVYCSQMCDEGLLKESVDRGHATYRLTDEGARTYIEYGKLFGRIKI